MLCNISPPSQVAQLRPSGRLIEQRVKKLMAERGDYKAWYYTPHITRKYQRVVRKETEELMERRPA